MLLTRDKATRLARLRRKQAGAVFARFELMRKEFDESKITRADDGKFGSGPGSGAAKPAKKPAAKKPPGEKKPAAPKKPAAKKPAKPNPAKEHKASERKVNAAAKAKAKAEKTAATHTKKHDAAKAAHAKVKATTAKHEAALAKAESGKANTPKQQLAKSKKIATAKAKIASSKLKESTAKLGIATKKAAADKAKAAHAAAVKAHETATANHAKLGTPAPAATKPAPAKKPVAAKPASKPAVEAKPVEKPAEKPTEKPTEKPVEAAKQTPTHAAALKAIADLDDDIDSNSHDGVSLDKAAAHVAEAMGTTPAEAAAELRSLVKSGALKLSSSGTSIKAGDGVAKPTAKPQASAPKREFKPSSPSKAGSGSGPASKPFAGGGPVGDAVKGAMEHLTRYTQYEDGLMDLGKIHDELQKVDPSLTVPEFHAVLQDMRKSRELDLSVINEVSKLGKGDIPIVENTRDGGQNYYQFAMLR